MWLGIARSVQPDHIAGIDVPRTVPTAIVPSTRISISFIFGPQAPPKGGKVGEKCSGHVVYGEPYWITWSVSPHLFDVMAVLMGDIRPLLLKATPEEKIRSQYLPSSEIAMDQAEIDNWAKIAESMEGNGDTESWFYLRARAIADGKPDPMPNVSQLMPESA